MSQNHPINEPKKDKPVDGIGAEIDLFVNQIGALAETLPLTITVIRAVRTNSHQKVRKFIDEECQLIGAEGNSKNYNIPLGLHDKFMRLMARDQKAELAGELVPRGLLVALVSQFDAFLGGLIRQLFKLKPEILNSSENGFTLKQLTEFGSIDAAREYVIDKEIESVLRKSHSDHFDWFENKFGLPLRKDLTAWPIFIEVTERRNLFVHTNGTISNQYLEVCRRHSCEIAKDLRLGQSLKLTNEYFDAAYECLYEIGVKLGQVLWRKVQPSELRKADANLTRITFNLISEDRYRLARTLLDFATETIKKHSEEATRLTLVVNRAQTYKWLGENDRCLQIMEGEDWSATDLKFRLANAVLRDDFKSANALIKQMGSNGELDKHMYREWPIFKELRKSSEFATVFEGVFGEPLNEVTVQEPN